MTARRLANASFCFWSALASVLRSETSSAYAAPIGKAKNPAATTAADRYFFRMKRSKHDCRSTDKSACSPRYQRNPVTVLQLPSKLNGRSEHLLTRTLARATSLLRDVNIL